MTLIPFASWLATQLDCSEDDLVTARIDHAFDIIVCRIEDAVRHHAADPLAAVRNTGAGGNSRMATRRMLKLIGYSADQLRFVHRLLAGSPSGWPGLLAIYVQDSDLTPEQRLYARRHVEAILEGETGSDHERNAARAS